MKEVKLFEEKENCFGCMACKNICPKKAIDIETDEEGFAYPKIDSKLCINCNLCKKVCPIFKQNEKIEQFKIYAAKLKNEEMRIKSSSGGVFTPLAEYIMQAQGTVYGAAYNQEHKVEHIKCSNEKQLEFLRGSKYLQSNMKNIYHEIQKDLENKKMVLFSGTPCQISAVQNFVKNKETLYTIDLICHGVPSPMLFEEYKKYLEKEYQSRIISINFRYKENGQTQKIKIIFENGKEYISCYKEKDPYYQLFLKDYILRKSCYKCKFANMSRVSDITIGDFWGIEKSNPQFKDDKGVSLILINTPKGMELFQKVQHLFELIEVTQEECMQRCLQKPVDIPEERNKIWEIYYNNGFEKLAYMIRNDEINKEK